MELLFLYSKLSLILGYIYLVINIKLLPVELGHALRAKHNIARNFKNNMMMEKSRLPHPITCRNSNARLFHHESHDTCCNGGKIFR